MIRVVPPVATGEERFKALKIMRPRFRSPERILTFQWPRHARGLVESGLWDRIVQRLVGLGWPDTAEQCDTALSNLLAEERKSEVEAIRGGEGFKTIWSRETPARE